MKNLKKNLMIISILLLESIRLHLNWSDCQNTGFILHSYNNKINLYLVVNLLLSNIFNWYKDR